MNLNRTQLNRQRKQDLLFAIFVFTVIGLVSLLIPVYSSAQTTGTVTKTNTTKAAIKKEEKPDYAFSMSAQISRGTSLIDHQDGSRSDSMAILAVPSLSTPIGNFAIKESFSKNLNDDSDTQDGFSDASVIYSFKPLKWVWTAAYTLALRPSLTAVIPLSEISVKKNQMQTALIAGVNFSILPNTTAAGLALQKDGAWNVSVGLTAGKNFYPYEEDINGQPLNAYSSNQSLTVVYGISDWSFSVELVHRSRWTFQGNTKASFVASEEIVYGLTPNFSLALGHTNDAAAMKANGVETNYNLVDENTSTVYISAEVTF